MNAKQNSTKQIFKAAKRQPGLCWCGTPPSTPAWDRHMTDLKTAEALALANNEWAIWAICRDMVEAHEQLASNAAERRAA